MRDQIRFRVSFVVPFILLLVGGSSPVATANGAAPIYTIIDLGTPGVPLTRNRFLINARGHVVVDIDTSDGYPHAFLWQPSTGWQDLGNLGGRESYPLGINAQGQIVGWAYKAVGPAHAFLWEAVTGMQDLGTLPDVWGIASSYPTGINARGQVAGFSGIYGSGHAFLYEA